MAKSRTAKKVLSGVQEHEFESALADFAALDAKEQAITAKMDEQITRIREKNADALADIKAKKEEKFEVVQTYCEERKAELFSKRRSIETIHGNVGFRTGTPKLKTLKGFTWAAVTNMLKVVLPDYVRTVDEPAKDKLLADRDTELVQMKLAEAGLFVDQDEAFFVDLKKEEVAA